MIRRLIYISIIVFSSNIMNGQCILCKCPVKCDRIEDIVERFVLCEPVTSVAGQDKQCGSLEKLQLAYDDSRNGISYFKDTCGIDLIDAMDFYTRPFGNNINDTLPSYPCEDDSGNIICYNYFSGEDLISNATFQDGYIKVVDISGGFVFGRTFDPGNQNFSIDSLNEFMLLYESLTPAVFYENGFNVGNFFDYIWTSSNQCEQVMSYVVDHTGANGRIRIRNRYTHNTCCSDRLTGFDLSDVALVQGLEYRLALNSDPAHDAFLCPDTNDDLCPETPNFSLVNIQNESGVSGINYVSNQVRFTPSSVNWSFEIDLGCDIYTISGISN